MESFPIVLLFVLVGIFKNFDVAGAVACVYPMPVSDEHTTVTGQSPGEGSCCFKNTLCSYKQGYMHLMNWTATNNGVAAIQKGLGAEDTIHSDLTSSLPTFHYVRCAEFSYQNYMPATLSVIGAFFNGTEHELYRGPSNENVLNKNITVPRDVKMLKFRAYGRGANVGRHTIILYYVALHQGNCGGPDCSFTILNKPTLCDWETDGWVPGNINSFSVAHLKDSVPAGTLTTGLVKATPMEGICVQFDYIFDSVNDTLSMLIQKAGDSYGVSVWVSTNNGTQSGQRASAAVCVVSESAFKLVFSAKRCNNPHSLIAIYNVISNTITNTSPCRQQSSLPAVEIPHYEGCVPNPSTTTTTEKSPTSTSVTIKPVTTNSKPSSSEHATSADVTHSATDADNTGSLGVVVGSALAGIGVIGAAVIVTVVVWRKRKQKRRGAQDKNVLKSKMVDLQQNDSLHGNKAGPASQNTYSETRNHAFSLSPHSAVDYSEVNHTEHSYNPYDDAFPDNAELTTSEGYSHVDILGADKKTKQRTSITNPYELAGAMPSADTCTDEYHHLSLQPGATKPKVNSARSPTQPDYSHIAGHSKLQPQDVYSVPSVQDVYSVPAPAAANQQEDEYNRINSKQPSRTKRQGDATPDVYNRLGHVNAAFDEGTDAAEGEYNKVGEKIPTSKQPRGATRDDYDRIDGVVPPDGNPGGFEKGKTGEESDQYNTLNFDEGEQRRQNAASDKKTTQPRKAYDHVQDEFQDTYAKTQRDKRERVIDSNYDHVTPDETRVN